MKSIVASEITKNATVQVGRLRGRVVQVDIASAPVGATGFTVVTIKNGRRLIFCSTRQIKVRG